MELVPAGLKGSAVVTLDRRAELAANGTRLKEHICKNKKKRQPWATSEGSRDSDDGLLRTYTQCQELALPAPLAGPLVEVALLNLLGNQFDFLQVLRAVT